MSLLSTYYGFVFIFYTHTFIHTVYIVDAKCKLIITEFIKNIANVRLIMYILSLKRRLNLIIYTAVIYSQP